MHHSLTQPANNHRSIHRLAAPICALLAALIFQPVSLHAQPAAPNRVLELDGGTNSYVELPPNIFNGLTDATIEGWVKWKVLRTTSTVFEYGSYHARGRCARA